MPKIQWLYCKITYNDYMDQPISITQLFPIPLIRVNLKDFFPNLTELNKLIIKDFIEHLNKKGYRQSSGQLNVYQSEPGIEEYCSNIQSFLRIIKPTTDIFLEKLNYSNSFLKNYKLSGAWGNLTAELGYHSIHVHGKGSNEPFSFVYYPCQLVDPEDLNNILFLAKNNSVKLGSIFFYDPAWDIKQITYKKSDGGKSVEGVDFSKINYSIEPEEGLLVMFPSYLQHTVEPSLGLSKNLARFSLSFFAKID